MNMKTRCEKEQIKKRDESSIVCKKPNYDYEAIPDRLSELPDHLLVEVISLLKIEEAVRTGVLSTRWKNLWKYMHNIVHRQKAHFLSPEKQSSFITFVDHTLLQCICPKTFDLVADHKFDEVHFRHLHKQFDRWLQRVFSGKVESLIVDISSFSYVPPQWFYRNSTLVNLQIDFWNLKILGPVVSWTSLRSLTLHFVTMGDEEIASILSGCPVLESLLLHDVEVNSLNIMSPRMVELTVTYNAVHKGGLLEINAPWLQILKLEGWFGDIVVWLVDVSSLVHADLDIYNVIDEDHVDVRLDVVTELVEKLHHVQELTIGRYSISALSLFKLSGEPCSLFKCKRLTLILSVFKHELPGISYVLQSSPHLEMLVIDVRKWWKEDIPFDNEGADYFSMESWDFMHLKSIEVNYHCEVYNKFPDYFTDEEDFAFQLLACIIGRAPVLEKLVIKPQEELCKCSTNWARECSSMLCIQLFQFFLDQKQVVEWKLRKKYVEIIF